MIFEFFFMFFASLFLAVAVGIGICKRDADADRDLKLEARERYLPWFSCFHMVYFAVHFALYAILEVAWGFSGNFLDGTMPTFFCFAIYYAILIPMVPLLRRWFSARACAMMWMIPMTLAYFSVFSFKGGEVPFLVVHIPFGVTVQVVRVVFWVWLGGAVAVLGWYIVSHLRFRRWLLKDARSVTFGPMLEALRQEEQFANIQGDPFLLFVSKQAKTPLSIGLSRGSTCVVLPKRDYSSEELALIFRHELVHIGRKDSMAKFFIAFFTAVFWFFPLMWVAVRRFADELELSCDETVLVGREEDARRQYAELLLDTVADQRGFTTCLSVSAGALRYRLKNVVAPRKRLVGGVMVGVVTFLMMMLCASVTFSYHPGTAAERIFPDPDPAMYELGDVRSEEVRYSEGDRDAVMGYLMELEVAQLSEEYSLVSQPEMIQMDINGQNENYRLIMTQRYMLVQTYTQTGMIDRCYYLSTPLDREYLLSLMGKAERYEVVTELP